MNEFGWIGIDIIGYIDGELELQTKVNIFKNKIIFDIYVM